MKIDGLSHPKTKELAFSLDIPLAYAIGLLELLWSFCGQKTPQGNIGRWSNQVIASEAGWPGDADRFVMALVRIGWLDEHPDHRLIVHDWKEHCPNWVRAKLKRADLDFLEPAEKGSVNHQLRLDPDISPDIRADYKPSQAKPSQAKAVEAAPASERAAPPPESKGTKTVVQRPEWADPQVWADWKRARKAPLTVTAWARNLPELDRARQAGHDLNDFLAVHAERGWRGLTLEGYERELARKGAPNRPDPRKAWDEVLNASTLHPSKRREWLDQHPELKPAINAAGGMGQIGQAQPYQQQELRDRFCSALIGSP